MDRTIDDIIEERIREALAGDQWLGFKVLQNGGTLPAWLGLAKEIEVERAALRSIDARHAEWVALAAASGDWARYASAIQRLRADYERKARALRSRQDRFNFEAPSLALGRPGIWVDYLLSRLDERVRLAGAPDDLFAASA